MEENNNENLINKETEEASITLPSENIEDKNNVLEENTTEQTSNLSSNNNDVTKESEEKITVRPVKFQEFKDTEPNRAIKKNLDIMQDVDMHISVELGKTKSSIREVMEMEKGTVVELDKIAGEQVEIYVNEKLVAKGEVIVIEDKFGVRVTSTSIPKGIPNP